MTTLAAANRTIALWAAAAALTMVGLAFASVPLYRVFCSVTGFAGTTGRAVASPSAARVRAIGGRTIKVRFDGNTSPGMPWSFKPVAVETIIPIGERRMAFFRATNISGAVTTGRATFNVSPDTAGKYFKKIACFCFTQQTLKPGETVDMPVTYFIDLSIVDDPDASKIDEITLSYTFFPVDASKADPVSPPA
ncbi:MAG: cytochrome c oxidase assembly protein [Janthinobacterium lividum]